MTIAMFSPGRHPRHRRVHRQVLFDRRLRGRRLRLARRGDRGGLDDLARLLPAGHRRDVDGPLRDRSCPPSRRARVTARGAAGRRRPTPARSPRWLRVAVLAAAATIVFGIVPVAAVRPRARRGHLDLRPLVNRRNPACEGAGDGYPTERPHSEEAHPILEALTGARNCLHRPVRGDGRRVLRRGDRFVSTAARSRTARSATVTSRTAPCAATRPSVTASAVARSRSPRLARSRAHRRPNAVTAGTR